MGRRPSSIDGILYMHHPVVLAVLFFLASLAATSAALGQEPEAEEVDRWAFVFDVGFNGQTGNTEVAVLNTGFRVTHLQKEDAEFEWSASYRYGWSQGDVVAQQARSSLKFDLYPNQPWSPFVYTQVDHNPISKLDVRTSGGAGVKYTVLQGPRKQEYSVSVAGLYNYENYARGRSAPIRSRQEPRMSWRLRGAQPLGKDADVGHTTFFQPVWDRPGDYDIEAKTTASAMLREGVFLSVEHVYRNDSTPVEGVLREDQWLTVGLRFKF